MAVPDDSGCARRAGPRAHPGGAGQAVVGDAAAVRLAARPVDRPTAGANLVGDAGRGNPVRDRHRVLNIQYDYIFGFSFYTGHYFAAWVFIAGFAMHVALKFPECSPVCDRCRCEKYCAPGLSTHDRSRPTPTGWCPPIPPTRR
ncbi:putative transmembrane protein [Mycobacterium xenopi 3993]|nr:putative transmembrane protein [Mycobacterium xenopi 3993]